MLTNICGVAILLIFLTLIFQVKTDENVSVMINKRPAKCLTKTQYGDTVKIHYRGKVENGIEFDRSPVNKPFSFKIGDGRVIKGLDEGMINMCEGETRTLIIPPDLAYGENGAPPRIPPNATVIYHVQLIEMDRQKDEKTLDTDSEFLRKMATYLNYINLMKILVNQREECLNQDVKDLNRCMIPFFEKFNEYVWKKRIVCSVDPRDVHPLDYEDVCKVQ